MTNRTRTDPGPPSAAAASVPLALNSIANGLRAVTLPLVVLHHRAQLILPRFARFWDPCSDIDQLLAVRTAINAEARYRPPHATGLRTCSRPIQAVGALRWM